MAQIIEISPKHEAIILFILAHPELHRNDVASHFGVTPAWLSTLLRSDLIRARLKDVQGSIADELVIDVKDRIQELAHKSLEKLTQRIDAGAIDNDDLIDAAELAVKNVLGIGTPKGVQVNIQQNIAYPSIDQESLARARARMLPQPQVQTLEVVPSQPELEVKQS